MYAYAQICCVRFRTSPRNSLCCEWLEVLLTRTSFFQIPYNLPQLFDLFRRKLFSAQQCRKQLIGGTVVSPSCQSTPMTFNSESKSFMSIVILLSHDYSSLCSYTIPLFAGFVNTTAVVYVKILLVHAFRISYHRGYSNCTVKTRNGKR